MENLTGPSTEKDDSRNLTTSAQTPTRTLRIVLICPECRKEFPREFTEGEIPERYKDYSTDRTHELMLGYPCDECLPAKAEERAERCIRARIGERYLSAQLSDGFYFKGDQGRKKPINPDRFGEFLATRYRKGNNFYITGEMGSGKTRLAAAILRHCTKAFYCDGVGYDAYLNGYELRNAITPESDDWEDYIKSPLLIIDEIISGSEFVGERMFALVDTRYRKNRFTIGISNLSRQAIMAGQSSFGEDFGPKIISRLTREGDRDSVLELVKK